MFPPIESSQFVAPTKRFSRYTVLSRSTRSTARNGSIALLFYFRVFDSIYATHAAFEVCLSCPRVKCPLCMYFRIWCVCVIGCANVLKYLLVQTDILRMQHIAHSKSECAPIYNSGLLCFFAKGEKRRHSAPRTLLPSLYVYIHWSRFLVTPLFVIRCACPVRIISIIDNSPSTLPSHTHIHIAYISRRGACRLFTRVILWSALSAAHHSSRISKLGT